MKALRLVEKFVYESSGLAFALGLVWLVLVKVGIWVFPFVYRRFELARDPFTNPYAVPESDYVLSSWLGPFLAWLLGVRDFEAFVAFQFVLALGFVALFGWLAARRLPPDLARTATVLFVLLPVSATPFFWVGVDGLTLLLLLAALAAAPRVALVFAFGLLAGVEHFEQALVGTAALCGAVALGRPLGASSSVPLRACVALLAGVVAGRLVLAGVFHAAGLHARVDRLDWLLLGLDGMVGHFLANAHVVLWSALGVGWLVALRFADRGRRALPFFLALAGLCLMMVVTNDQTRVVAVVTFPLIYVHWLSDRDFLASLGRTEVAGLFGLWVLVPWTWTWNGMVETSVFPYDVALLLHVLFGWSTPRCSIPARSPASATARCAVPPRRRGASRSRRRRTTGGRAARAACRPAPRPRRGGAPRPPGIRRGAPRGRPGRIAGEPVDLLLVMDVDEGLDGGDREVDRARPGERRQGAGEPSGDAPQRQEPAALGRREHRLDAPQMVLFGREMAAREGADAGVPGQGEDAAIDHHGPGLARMVRAQVGDQPGIVQGEVSVHGR